MPVPALSFLWHPAIEFRTMKRTGPFPPRRNPTMTGSRFAAALLVLIFAYPPYSHADGGDAKPNPADVSALGFAKGQLPEGPAAGDAKPKSGGEANGVAKKAKGDFGDLPLSDLSPSKIAPDL